MPSVDIVLAVAEDLQAMYVNGKLTVEAKTVTLLNCIEDLIGKEIS
jgi:hypothetical protein